MAENSKIEWTDHTVNLWWGCSKVHTGCKNCYADYFSTIRLKEDFWGDDKPRKLIFTAFYELSRYQKQAKKQNIKVKVFIGSMMDIFEDDKEIINKQGSFNFTEDLRDELFLHISNGEYENIIFLLLTKRPENIVHHIPYEWLNNTPKNVWFGTSISNQETVKYAESLKLVSNTNLFLSIEPQIGRINQLDLTGIDWVIQGGESGNKKRPFDIEWAESMKLLCNRYKVPYFFKQIDKIQVIPEHLIIKEYPEF